MFFVVEHGVESVFLAAEPALAGVIDFGDVPRATGDHGRSFQFHEWCTVDEGLDMQVWECDKVALLLSRVVLVRGWGGDCQQGMADLLDLDGVGKGCLLRIVSL